MPHQTSSRFLNNKGSSYFILVLLGAIVAAFGFGAFWAFTPANPTSPPTEIAFLVSQKQSAGEIGRALEGQGLINQSRAFSILARISGQSGRIKVGEYALNSNMSPLRILSVLTSGLSIQYPVTLKEGLNLYEIAQKLAQTRLVTAEDFIRVCKDAAFSKSLIKDGRAESLEGFLFPDTYNLTRLMSAEDIAKMMVKKFFDVWSREFSALEKSTPMKTVEGSSFRLYDWITLASIVEKETGVGSDRGKVSSVFHNRISKKMKLQSDPTTIYGIWETYKGNITKRDLQTSTPYNTYTVPGLPKGPISNPGIEAIRATFSPEKTEFLYFVSRNDGTTEFTRSYEEHLQAVRRFQLDPRARDGKSWRQQSPSAQ